VHQTEVLPRTHEDAESHAKDEEGGGNVKESVGQHDSVRF
jgi:hypothetical protein